MALIAGFSMDPPPTLEAYGGLGVRGFYRSTENIGYDEGFAAGVASVASVPPNTVGGIGYFGAYFGASIATTIVEASPPPLLGAIKSPLAPTDPDYVDHTTKALDRLPQYAKHKSTS